MVVNTKKVTNRRKLRFDNYNDLLADVDQLANSEIEILGNWNLSQNLSHLAKAYRGSLEGLDFKPSFVIKIFARLLMKKKFIYQAIPSGFQIPNSSKAGLTVEEDFPLEQSLQDFREVVERLKIETHRVEHPIFGKLTREEWDNFNWRHAEMHLSFLRVKEQET